MNQWSGLQTLSAVPSWSLPRKQADGMQLLYEAKRYWEQFSEYESFMVWLSSTCMAVMHSAYLSLHSNSPFRSSLSWVSVLLFLLRSGLKCSFLCLLIGNTTLLKHNTDFPCALLFIVGIGKYSASIFCSWTLLLLNVSQTCNLLTGVLTGSSCTAEGAARWRKRKEETSVSTGWELYIFM